jgi:hypothetical protein
MEVKGVRMKKVSFNFAKIIAGGGQNQRERE